MNYAVQYNALQRRYESLLADMQQVLGLLRRRRIGPALSLLESVLGDETESDAEDAEAAMVEDAEADQPIQIDAAPSGAVAPAGFAPFVGPVHRLD